MRGPGVTRGVSSGELVANIDIAPTVLDLGGVDAPDWMDGRSLVPLLDGSVPDSWRSSLLIEGVRSGSPRRPDYVGVRRGEKVYVAYENGETEYYDLARDPHQLENRPQDAPQTVKKELEALRDCAGEACG